MRLLFANLFVVFCMGDFTNNTELIAETTPRRTEVYVNDSTEFTCSYQLTVPLNLSQISKVQVTWYMQHELQQPEVIVYASNTAPVANLVIRYPPTNTSHNVEAVLPHFPLFYENHSITFHDLQPGDSAQLHCEPNFFNGSTRVDGISTISSLIVNGAPQCLPNVCKNGGSCHEGLSNLNFTCHCTSNYTDPTCSTAIPCASIPCGMGGTCIEDENEDFYCDCFPGYVGNTCATGMIGVFIEGTTHMNDGDTLNLSCVLTMGLPADVYFQWTFLQSEGPSRILCYSQMYLKDGATFSDSGTYRCEAITKWRSAFDSVTVQVHEPNHYGNPEYVKSEGGSGSPLLSKNVLTSLAVTGLVVGMVFIILAASIVITRKKKLERFKKKKMDEENIVRNTRILHDSYCQFEQSRREHRV